MDFTTPPPARRPTMMMGSITALGNQTESNYYGSQGTEVYMHDPDDFSYGDEEMPLDSPCRPSIESDENDTALRGGVLHPPPHLAWARNVTISSQTDDQPVKEESESGYDDFKERVLDAEDNESVSSDWDHYGDLPLTMNEYDRLIAKLEENEDWNADQKKLHKLIYMRGLHPMMPSWWRVSFRMWGITQPQLDDVFTPKHSKKRVAIHAYGNEVAAAKALESLFYLSQVVTDYEEVGNLGKIPQTVVKCIRGYIKWAMRDAGIDQKKSPTNMIVRAYPVGFRLDDDDAGSDFAPSPTSDNEDGEGESVVAKGAEDFKVAEARRGGGGADSNDAVSRDMERRFKRLAKQWRELLWDKKRKAYIHDPPTLYAFAVIQHVVLLTSYDSRNKKSQAVVVEQVALNSRGQWLWNALTLALPVNMARDALVAMWHTGKLVKLEENKGDDPDR